VKTNYALSNASAERGGYIHAKASRSVVATVPRLRDRRENEYRGRSTPRGGYTSRQKKARPKDDLAF
jgi:hypothetical protein